MGSTVRYSKFDAKKLTLFYEIYDLRINNGHFSQGSGCGASKPDTCFSYIHMEKRNMAKKKTSPKATYAEC